MTKLWAAIGGIHLADLRALLMPALTLSVLLSIDTLKTCVIVDALTRSRHNSNRELIGQGIGNLASALVGGVPGAGTMVATLVNVNSGGKTRLSSILEGVFVLLALLLLSRLIG
jgi:SulP family sulfate permease